MIEPCGDIKLEKRAFPGPTWKCGSCSVDGGSGRVYSALFQSLLRPDGHCLWRRKLSVDQREIRVANCSLCTPSCFATGILQGGVKTAQHTTHGSQPCLLFITETWISRRIKMPLINLCFKYCWYISPQLSGQENRCVFQDVCGWRAQDWTQIQFLWICHLTCTRVRYKSILMVLYTTWGCQATEVTPFLIKVSHVNMWHSELQSKKILAE